MEATSSRRRMKSASLDMPVGVRARGSLRVAPSWQVFCRLQVGRFEASPTGTMGVRL
jgi:hypothetical protein